MLPGSPGSSGKRRLPLGGLVEKPSGVVTARSEIRADALIKAYEQGPFRSAPLPDWPPALVQLFERFSGRKFDPAAFAEYERVRAFLDYAGVELTGPLRQAQWLEDTVPERENEPPVKPPGLAARGPSDEVLRERVRNVTRGPGAAYDPSDLGD